MTRTTDFFRERREAFVGYVRRRIDSASAADAEDIVQDVFLGLFDRPDPTIPIQDLAAFIYQSLRNRIVDLFRKRRDALPLREDVPAGTGDPSLEWEKREALKEVFDALESLSPDERAVILETEIEERSFKELSAEWGIPMGTLLARKSRGLEKIRNQLAARKAVEEGEWS